MAETRIAYDGVTYRLSVESDFEGRTHIQLETSSPPLGLSPVLYEFSGRLPSEEQRKQGAKEQSRAGQAPLSAHDQRRR